MNLQGDIVGIVNQSGNQLVGYTYDAWGNILTTTGSSANTLGKYNPLRYRGYVYDSEIGYYYLQSRYYDPEVSRFINADAFASTGQGAIGCNILAYCLNNPVRYIDVTGNWAKVANEGPSTEDSFKVVGAGIQISGSASLGPISGGGGIEIIVFWDTPESKAAGKPIVAVYICGEADITIDTDGIDEIIELLLDSADVLKMDGVNALEALVAGTKVGLSASVSPFVVTANSEFYGVEDYTKGFNNQSANFGSVTVSKAWSDTCRTYSVGYTYAAGKPGLWLKLPSFSRGCSYYGLLWTSA